MAPPPDPAPDEVKKPSLFKRKGAAIAKLSSLSFGTKVSQEEMMREREVFERGGK